DFSGLRSTSPLISRLQRRHGRRASRYEAICRQGKLARLKTLVRMFLGIAVGRECRNEVANPAQQSARTDPEAGRDNQPEGPTPDRWVVDLPHSGNKKAQYRRCSRIFHIVIEFERYNRTHLRSQFSAECFSKEKLPVQLNTQYEEMLPAVPNG